MKKLLTALILSASFSYAANPTWTQITVTGTISGSPKLPSVMLTGTTDNASLILGGDADFDSLKVSGEPVTAGVFSGTDGIVVTPSSGTNFIGLTAGPLGSGTLVLLDSGSWGPATFAGTTHNIIDIITGTSVLSYNGATWAGAVTTGTSLITYDYVRTATTMSFVSLKVVGTGTNSASAASILGIFSGTTTLNVSVSALSTAEQLVPVPGANTANVGVIAVGYSGTLPNGLIEASRRLVTTGTVGVSFFNATALTITSTNIVMRADFIRY